MNRILKKILILLLVLCLLPCWAGADTVLYRARITLACYVHTAKEDNSPTTEYLPLNSYVNITGYDTEWLTVQVGGQKGYIRRNKIDRATPVDPVTTPPYGVEKSTYIATVAQTAPVLDLNGELLNTLGEGSRISILRLEDGYAVVPYYRTFGYIDSRLLRDLIPVSVTDKPSNPRLPIASFTTYFDYQTPTETNQNRVVNLIVSCVKLNNMVIPSGKTLDYNTEIGPFNSRQGYKIAPVFADGTTKLGMGGGTCQVSSTVFNAILQLPGIDIIERRTHGRNGSVYLPIGMDSSVGTDTLNLIFKNNYDFDLRIEALAKDGALFIAFYQN